MHSSMTFISMPCVPFQEQHISAICRHKRPARSNRPVVSSGLWRDQQPAAVDIAVDDIQRASASIGDQQAKWYRVRMQAWAQRHGHKL